MPGGRFISSKPEYSKAAFIRRALGLTNQILGEPFEGSRGAAGRWITGSRTLGMVQCAVVPSPMAPWNPAVLIGGSLAEIAQTGGGPPRPPPNPILIGITLAEIAQIPLAGRVPTIGANLAEDRHAAPRLSPGLREATLRAAPLP
jgi:hypothetical protein